jgi:hypothetical protein
MKRFLSPNISGAGRAIRAAGAVAMLVGAWFAWPSVRWLSVVLGLSGAFVLFEALRGWCVLRACGIRTRY